MGKISSYAKKTAIVLTDYVLGNNSVGPTTVGFTWQDVLTLLQNNIPAAEGTFPVVASGLVWTGDSYGSTRAASMTSGRLRVNGTYINIGSVTGRVFTA